MGTRAAVLVQEATGLEVQAYRGWSWPCFFFGSLWYMAKGMWGLGLLWFVLSAATASVLHWIGIFYFAAVANRQYLEHLGARGYRARSMTEAEQLAETANRENRSLGYVVLAGVALALVALGLLAR